MSVYRRKGGKIDWLCTFRGVQERSDQVIDHACSVCACRMQHGKHGAQKRLALT